MRVLFATGIAAVATALVLASASAGPPPPPLTLHFGVSRQQPIAGKTFTGLTITDSEYAITDVHCGYANIGARSLRSHFQRFYSDTVEGPSAVSCGWRIPAHTAGKTLWVTTV